MGPILLRLALLLSTWISRGKRGGERSRHNGYKRAKRQSRGDGRFNASFPSLREYSYGVHIHILRTYSRSVMSYSVVQKHALSLCTARCMRRLRENWLHGCCMDCNGLHGISADGPGQPQLRLADCQTEEKKNRKRGKEKKKKKEESV